MKPKPLRRIDIADLVQYKPIKTQVKGKEYL